MSFLWMAIAAAVVITLLVNEQVALLYVIATLSIAVLLVIVAFSDLRGARQATVQDAPFDDAAAIGDGVTRATADASFGSGASRAAKRQPRV